MASQHHTMFEVFHETQEIQDFRLVLCAEVWCPLVERVVRELEWAIDTEWVERGSASRPAVTSSPQVFLPATSIMVMDQIGWCGSFMPWYDQMPF